MKTYEWHPIAENPPKSGETYLVATDKLITTGTYRETEPDQDRKWKTPTEGWYINGVTHWMTIPDNPNKGGEYNSTNEVNWIKSQSLNRPKMGKNYLIASVNGGMSVGTYVSANIWDTFYEKVRVITISHWAELPKNPNAK